MQNIQGSPSGSNPVEASMASAAVEKMRQQYEAFPYPEASIDIHPRDAFQNLNYFYIHSLVTPYYLRHQTPIDTAGKVILDAGCGSGFKALMLAAANPGAKIVGIDLSPESVRLARLRLQHHGIEDFEFHAMQLEDVQQLGLEFDYINCDEVLYLLPDPAAGLKALVSVLKPEGMIRTNLHSALQRHDIYRAQSLVKLMGLMDTSPSDIEVGILRETMNALQDFVDLKKKTWDNALIQNGTDAHVMVNYFLMGDRGFSTPAMFEMIHAAGAEFICMTNWRHWELRNLFKDATNLPTIWELALPDLTIEEQLHIFEVLHPIDRLLDFWCGKPVSVEPVRSIDSWSPQDWACATIQLHPVLKNDRIRSQLVQSIERKASFDFSQHISLPTLTPILVNSIEAGLLLPLWDEPQTIDKLIERYLRLHPVDLVTLDPLKHEQAFGVVSTLIQKLELYLYVLVSF
ncbi:MAG: class I SAM-dependent methyltransferase [Cyanobacteria bacterium J06633_2]